MAAYQVRHWRILVRGIVSVNRIEKEKFQVAFMNLDSLLQKDKNAVITAEEVMDWLESFTGWRRFNEA